MKRKILILLSCLILLTGCSSQTSENDKQESPYFKDYTKIHLHDLNKCYEIKELIEFGDHHKIILKTGAKIYISDVRATLIYGNCPFCEDK